MTSFQACCDVSHYQLQLTEGFDSASVAKTHGRWSLRLFYRGREFIDWGFLLPTNWDEKEAAEWSEAEGQEMELQDRKWQQHVVFDEGIVYILTCSIIYGWNMKILKQWKEISE